VEIVPSDTVKYEIDKPTGYLRVDRPQRFSNVCPTPYGFLPQTFCGDRVAARTSARTGIPDMIGDGDPLDVCIFTERNIAHADILLTAIPIGGLRMVDSGQADDKIVAVLHDDGAFGSWRDISDCPKPMVDRLRHYFLTYKAHPGQEPSGDRFIAEVYGRDEAHAVIELSCQDYCEKFPEFFEPDGPRHP
jgi:inorganic pyrophosphatase